MNNTQYRNVQNSAVHVSSQEKCKWAYSESRALINFLKKCIRKSRKEQELQNLRSEGKKKKKPLMDKA